MSAPDIDEVATFVRVVRHGSLAGAAADLSVPKSTVSRRIARLEGRLNTQLLHRGPRSIRVSREGKRLYDRVAGSVDAIELAVDGALVDADAPRGHIRLTAPLDFGRLVLIDELVTFAEAFPEITVDLDLTDRFVDLVAEGFDLAVRAGKVPDTAASKNLVGRRLMQPALHLAAAPELASDVTCLDDVARLPFVLFRSAGTEGKLRLRDGAGRTQELHVRGRFVVHDFTAMAELVARGAGVGLMPDIHIDRSVAPGKLVRLLPHLSSPVSGVSVLYPARRLPARVRELIDHLTRRLARVG